MPKVGGKKYPYTPAGMAAADYAKKKSSAKRKPTKRAGKPRAGKSAYQRALSKKYK